MLDGLNRDLARRAFEGLTDFNVPAIARRDVAALLKERPELRDPQRFEDEVLTTLPAPITEDTQLH